MGLTILILVLLAVAFLLRLDFIFYIIYVCLGIFVISRWYAPRAMRKLRMTRTFTDRAFLGETVEVELNWENRSRMPLPWLEFNESLPPELRLEQSTHQVIALRGRESTSFRYVVQASRRGYYRIGPLRLSGGDLFGLTRKITAYLDTEFLTVYPRIIPLTQLGLPSRLPFGTIASHQRLFEDPARPMGVREFRSGDSLRQINWKVSAHVQDLMVKTYQPAISLETAVLLNLHRPDYARRDWQHYTEWAIAVATSLATHLIEQRQPVGLITNGVDPLLAVKEGEWPAFHKSSGRLVLPSNDRFDARQYVPPAIAPRSGRGHLMKLLEQLARIESEPTQAFADWLVPASLHLSWGVTLLIVTARGDVATCNQVHRLVRTGFNPILIAIEPDYNFSDVRERARRLGFHAFNVVTESDLDRWRRPQDTIRV